MPAITSVIASRLSPLKPAFLSRRLVSCTPDWYCIAFHRLILLSLRGRSDTVSERPPNRLELEKVVTDLDGSRRGNPDPQAHDVLGHPFRT